jgi:DNA-binding transcriptional ArsR family regulator
MALRLQWSDERYVRIYTRDTLDWSALSWDAQGLWTALNRKATRTGRIDLGRVGRRGVAALVGRAELADRLGAALDELLADGCVRIEGSALVIPDFIEAQEAVSSGAKRMREHRERQREAEEEAASGATPGDAPSPSGDETSPGDETSQNVTRGYSTAQHGTEGTARPPGRGAAVPAREDAGNGTGAPAGDALSRSFAAELDEEASREDRQRARTLCALGAAWRTVAEIAEALKRSPRKVESDLVDLRREGVVERQEVGTPPVMHWRRKQRAGEADEGIRAGVAGAT